MRRIVFISTLAAVLFLTAIFLIPSESVEVSPEQTVEDNLQPEQIRMVLAGDIMLERGVEYMVEKYGSGDFKFPFLKIADYLKGADIVFANLEGPISDKGIKVGSIYSFRHKPESMGGLNYAGFNVISLANNHAFDYGREALENCLTRLSNVGIDYVGAGFSEDEAYSPLIKEIKDTKIGFLAYTNLGPETWKARGDNSGIAWIDEEQLGLVKSQIEKAKGEVDILIVSLHAGEEYQETPAQFQVDFAKMAVDAGANIIAGHHPHVVQPNEKYKEGWIFYSLGNFIFDQGFSEETMKGQIVEILIKSWLIIVSRQLFIIRQVGSEDKI